MNAQAVRIFYENLFARVSKNTNAVVKVSLLSEAHDGCYVTIAHKRRKSVGETMKTVIWFRQDDNPDKTAKECLKALGYEREVTLSEHDDLVWTKFAFGIEVEPFPIHDEKKPLFLPAWLEESGQHYEGVTVDSFGYLEEEERRIFVSHVDALVFRGKVAKIMYDPNIKVKTTWERAILKFIEDHKLKGIGFLGFHFLVGWSLAKERTMKMKRLVLEAALEGADIMSQQRAENNRLVTRLNEAEKDLRNRDGQIKCLERLRDSLREEIANSDKEIQEYKNRAEAALKQANKAHGELLCILLRQLQDGGQVASYSMPEYIKHLEAMYFDIMNETYVNDPNLG